MATPGAGATNYNVVQMNGTTEAVSGSTIVTLQRDQNGNVILGTTTLTPNTQIQGSGFAKGCMLIKSDVVAGTGANYLNKGDTTTANFTLITQA